MYTLMRLLSRRDLALQQAPVVTSSLIVAELFYKFGSFSLEVVAFLGTWFVLDAIYSTVRQSFDAAKPTPNR